jgi:hypothetical protein
MSDLTVSLIAAGAAVFGAVATQVPTIVNTVITPRRDRTAAQEKRRREAYAAFIDATQGILQSLSGLPPIEESPQGNATNRALEEMAKLQRVWATVVIVGTQDAWDASNKVKDIASHIVNLLQYEMPDAPQVSQEHPTGLVQELRDSCDQFTEVARKELN